MSNITLTGTDVFYKNVQAQTQTILNRGGARSSKSYSIMQKYVKLFLTKKKKSFFILRKTLPSLRISTHRLFLDMLDTFGVRGMVEEEKMNLNYYFNGNLFHFGSLDDPEKVKSTEWNYIWMEEATEFSFEDYTQLKLRLSAPTVDGERNELTLSFNPIDEFHWIKVLLLDTGIDDVLEIVSTYYDNPFLSADYIKTLEDLAKVDVNFHRVYALAEWGRLENLIFSNWSVVDTMPENMDEIFYGLDFGYNNPSALIECGLKDDVVYLDEKIYQSLLTNSDLITRMKEENMIEYMAAPIYADNAEPQRIEEIERAGFLGIAPAHKSVKDGIDFLKSKTIKITARSVNLIKEMKAYSWKVDRNGRVSDDPVKFMDHGIDSSRYGIYTHAYSMGGSDAVKMRWLA